MSHEYMKCRGCSEPFMEHLMSHTSKGSYCDSCYKKLGLATEVEYKLCSECGKKFLPRNFKTEYPEDMCRVCGVEYKEPQRDIDFLSEENQGRDIVLGFIHDKNDKRVGMRILERETARVRVESIKDQLRTWNFNINKGQFYPKCCKLSEFPVLSLPSGVEGNPLTPTAKLTTKVSGAWVLEEVDEGILRLVSVSGQTKDVTEATAISFHNNYKIANATVENGKLTGTYKKLKKDYGTDVFSLIERGNVQWIYYNPDGNDGEGQYIENNFDHEIIKRASEESNVGDFFDALGELSKQYILDNDGGAEFESLRKAVTTKKYDYKGCTEETMKKLQEFAGLWDETSTPTQKASKSPTTVSEDRVDKIPAQDDIEAMKALNELLKAASEAYYGDGESPLTDLEFDEKFDALLALESKTGVILPDSVTQGVGTEVKGKLPKVEHTEKLLSLDKTKDIAALKGLLNLDLDGEMGVLSWKLDGLTILATYDGGVLKRAVTRGNGRIGEDVTHNAKFFKGMPRRIPYKGELRVRGEAVIAYSTFERINANLPEGQEPYKNPRNLASGMVRRSEVTRDGSVEFIPFGLSLTDTKFQPQCYSQSMKFLSGQGFNPVYHRVCIEESIEGVVGTFKKSIDKYDYPTDGLVLIIDENFIYDKLGSTGHHPRGAIAFKWADEKQTTVLRHVEWSASRTGLLNPVAIFDPVELEGTTVKRASVHNLSMVKSLHLGIGDTISVYKANMIIPQIAENLTKSGTVQAPSTCPVCGGATAIRQEKKVGNVEQSEFVVCTNPECGAKNVGMLVHFAKRDAMDIGGISDKSVQELVSAGFIGRPIDYYNLKNHPEIAELPGWGKASYNKLLYAVDNSRTPRLANFIYALGIRNIGRSVSDAIAKHFGNLNDFLDATKEQISQVEGVGSGMTSDIVAFLSTHVDEVRSLAQLLTIVNPGAEPVSKTALPAGVVEGAPDCLNGLVFCVTGKIEFPGARDALSSYIVSLGGRMSSSVSKNTNYLITNTPNSGSSKNQSAQKLGCKIISEQSFFLLVKDLSEAITAPEREDNARIEEQIINNPTATAPEINEMTHGERVLQQGLDSVVIPEDPREARIQTAEAIQALSGVPLAGLTICVTGKVNYGTRAELHNFIEQHGGKVASSVTKGVDYLVTNTPFSGTSKNKSAQANGCHIISERDFMAMVDSGKKPEDYNNTPKPAAPYISQVYGTVNGKTFCITGRVAYPGKRAGLQAYIRSCGGYNADKVDYGVDYLITNDPFTDSTKNKEAKRIGCKVITEEQFLEMAQNTR